MTIEQIKEKVLEFLELYEAAPQFGYRSRLSKKKIEGRYNVKCAFVDSLTMLSIVCDKETRKYIDEVISRMEKLS